MYYADNEKWEKKINRRNRTAKLGKHKNVWREGKLQVLGNIGSGQHQRNRDVRIK